MFENLVTNIRRKFSKTHEGISDHGDMGRESYNTIVDRTGFKRSLHLFKTKLLKSEPTVPVIHCDNTALSPRAMGTAECAETEIAWPILTDNNPDILDKFTRIVTISDDLHCNKPVGVIFVILSMLCM